MAIAAIFCLQASWFVAWLSLDQRRIDAGRSAFAPCCLVHEKFAPSEGSQKEWGQLAFERFAQCLSHRLTQVAVILVTLGGDSMETILALVSA